jgi:hypothetical protein
LGWISSVCEPAVLLETYESDKIPRRRSSPSNFRLSREDREQLLLEWGVSSTDIVKAIRANLKAKNQRRRTVTSIGTYDRIEEAVEKTTRKIKQSLQVGKPMNKTKLDQWQDKNDLHLKSTCNGIASDEQSSTRVTLRSDTTDFHVSSTIQQKTSVDGDLFCTIDNAMDVGRGGTVNDLVAISRPIVKTKKSSDRPLMIPQRSASPVILSGIKLTSMQMESVGSFCDADFTLPLQNDFDRSITTCVTEDSAVIEISFGSDSDYATPKRKQPSEAGVFHYENTKYAIDTNVSSRAKEATAFTLRQAHDKSIPVDTGHVPAISTGNIDAIFLDEDETSIESELLDLLHISCAENQFEQSDGTSLEPYLTLKDAHCQGIVHVEQNCRTVPDETPQKKDTGGITNEHLIPHHEISAATIPPAKNARLYLSANVTSAATDSHNDRCLYDHGSKCGTVASTVIAETNKNTMQDGINMSSNTKPRRRYLASSARVTELVEV